MPQQKNRIGIFLGKMKFQCLCCYDYQQNDTNFVHHFYKIYRRYDNIYIYAFSPELVFDKNMQTYFSLQFIQYSIKFGQTFQKLNKIFAHGNPSANFYNICTLYKLVHMLYTVQCTMCSRSFVKSIRDLW